MSSWETWNLSSPVGTCHIQDLFVPYSIMGKLLLDRFLLLDTRKSRIGANRRVPAIRPPKLIGRVGSGVPLRRGFSLFKRSGDADMKTSRRVFGKSCESFPTKRYPSCNLACPIRTVGDNTWIHDRWADSLGQPWHSVPMRALIFALCLLTSPALGDVVGVASVINGDTI